MAFFYVPIGQTGKPAKPIKVEQPAAAGPAARQGSGGPRGAAIGGLPRGAPCGRPGSSLSNVQRRRRCLIAPALGRPLNSSAAPDVRAPSVRGRWHFRACFAPFRLLRPRFRTGSASPRLLGFALASPGGADIRLALMNEAIRPGPESPPQAVGVARAFGRRPHLQRARQRHHAVSAAGDRARRLCL